MDTWKVEDDLGRGFVAAPFKVQTATRRGREISALFIEDAPAKAHEYVQLAGDVIDALEPRFGAFPFGNYAIAALPASLAPPGFVGRAEPGYFVAHANTLAADRPNIPLIAHEISHSWWAIQVRCGGQGNQLLEEGMAQHAAALFTESRLGSPVATRHLRLNNVYPSQMAYACARGYFHLWRTGQDNAFLPGVDGSSIPYAKGAWIYHMLRHRVGDDAFFAILKRLVREYRGGSLTFADLRQAFEAHDSRLKTFFVESCERAGAPVLDLSWRRSGRGAEVTVRQLSSTYHLPIEIAVEGTEGVRVHRVELRDAVQTFSLGSSGLATGVRLDTEDKLLLWKPEYGPIPNVTPPMSDKAWRSWFDQEVRWILSVYTDVPAMSIAVRSRDGNWSNGYRVGEDTLFQAAQLSQLVSVTAALKVGLDLKQSAWQTPPVTLRQLLSHTSPLTLSGALSLEAGKARPTLDEMLGRVSASNASGYRPSAANYLVVQKLLEKPGFGPTVAEAVFKPFEMRRSTYSPSPGTFAIGHESGGKSVSGGYRIYPEAGQGLWTTAPEFARFVSGVMADKALIAKVVDGDTDASSYLGPAKAGLGVLVQGKWFHQVGLNVGYTALLIANPETGDVFVAFANDSDRALVPLIDLAQRVGLRYRWSTLPRFN